ncbi:DUF4760 domain-containing protein [Dactylosporangium sp. CS-047395]|uniref:DUF4760 domain-containing protein n=1 Tax=Dactylosporangium sp. CS-047395 TaxID=3239936 RepID=UPI003D8C98A6
MKPDAVSAIAAVAALIVNIVFLALLVKQLRLLQRQINDASEAFATEQLRVKRQSTLEHLAATMEHRRLVSSEVPSDTDIQAVKQFTRDADSNSPRGRLLRNYLNFYEDLAAGINAEVFDIEVVARTSGTIIVRVFDAYKDFIDRVRQATGHNLAYVEMEYLAQALEPHLERLQQASRDAPGERVSIP